MQNTDYIWIIAPKIKLQAYSRLESDVDGLDFIALNWPP